ncbi:universal stress protein [Natronomonas salsuginis]|uniref:Universal stress protein n=1 Tax=Natronomonas salsuginis TaxID=2217661 RepID=A0A4U5JAP7_9EURY|nr:universal stress protein [Natronomonas salsuginis]TKR25341.1 universal stress protein [Natronomonas salsuginis]
MTHILLAVDDDEDRARVSAEDLAELKWGDGVTVTVLHVFTDNVEGANVSQIGSAREARDILEASGIEVILDETSGSPAEEIIDYAGEEDIDIICLAGRSRTPAGKAVFGSVSQSVMLDSDIPVLFCPTSDL